MIGLRIIDGDSAVDLGVALSESRAAAL